MTFRESFPVTVLLHPAKAFGDIAAGKTTWAWPLGVYSLSTAVSVQLFTLLPPQFIAESFEGLTFDPGRSFFFYFGGSLIGGLLFSVFICSILSALARFLREGRLSLRLIAAGLAILAFGITAGAMHGAAGGGRVFGFSAAAAAALFAAWAGLSDGKRCAALLKSFLALSVLALACSLTAGTAALAGSVKIYTGIEYFFSLLSLYWLAKAVNAVYGAAGARAAAAAVLAICSGLAFLFLVYNLGLIPKEIFQALMMS
jgi:hypothetical protein